jgi:hypothetical protein
VGTGIDDATLDLARLDDDGRLEHAADRKVNLGRNRRETMERGLAGVRHQGRSRHLPETVQQQLVDDKQTLACRFYRWHVVNAAPDDDRPRQTAPQLSGNRLGPQVAKPGSSNGNDLGSSDRAACGVSNRANITDAAQP